MNISVVRSSEIELNLNGAVYKLTNEQARGLIKLVEQQLGQPYVIRVKRIVSAAYELSPAILDSPTRSDRVCLARFICFQLLKETGMSLIEIGEHFGGRDGSTVLSGLNSLKDRMDLRKPLKQEVDLLRQRVAI